MSKFYIILIALITIATSCSKVSENIETAEQLIGEWTAVSLKVDGDEKIVPNVSKFVTEFYDFEDTKGKYNLKVYGLGILLGETEGSAEVRNDGKQLILIEDGTNKVETSTIETLTDELLKLNGSNDNGESISFLGEKTN